MFPAGLFTYGRFIVSSYRRLTTSWYHVERTSEKIITLEIGVRMQDFQLRYIYELEKYSRSVIAAVIGLLSHVISGVKAGTDQRSIYTMSCLHEMFSPPNRR